jgi:adenosylmethionine-8-amino-7-oxononanoate aminotransferase
MSSSHLLKPCLNRDYPTVAAGRGVFLEDLDGRLFLDGSSGAMTASIGHGVAGIGEAMRRQSDTVAFAYRTQFTNAPAEALAAKLAALAPGDLDQVFFVNSGSEAVEHAMRTALACWRDRGRPEKTRILSRARSYHGMTMGALSLSGHPERRRSFDGLLHDFAVVPPAYCYRCPWERQPASCALECALAWESAVADGPESIAAIIVEPIVGAAGGVLPAPQGYLRRLRELCDRENILLIADEVITGLGRTGSWFACADDDVVPDMLIVGKGLTGGYAPLAATIIRGPLVDTLRRGCGELPGGHTFSANPLGTATGLAVLDHIERHDLLGNVRRRAIELEDGLRTIAGRHPVVSDVRGRGLLWGFELVRQGGAGPGEPWNASGRLVDLCFDNGLILYPAGAGPLTNALIIAPPLTITTDEVTLLLERLETSLIQLQEAS